jgi:hypothetical protein
MDHWSQDSGHPQGNVHAQGLQVVHYRNGSNVAYGFQLVSGGDSNPRMWTRKAWGGGGGTWYELALRNYNVGGDFYASIYYDSDNTGYYVDPNSTGVSLRIAGAIQSNHVSWTGEMNKIQWHSGNLYFQNMENGWWIFRKSDGSEPFMFNNGGHGNATESWRAPYFYDLDNTAYYTNPNGYSNIYSLATASAYTNNMDTGSGNVGMIRILGQVGTNWTQIAMSRPGVADSAYFFASDSWAPNGNAATLWLGSMSWTGRSLNATGAVSAYGGDYAEYMTKAGDFTIAKGDICGINVNGKLTNIFADAISFVVKSTKPSFVGGDEWGGEEELGLAALIHPVRLSDDTDETYEAKLAQYAIDKPIYDEVFETARAKVDRIAFSGQVPVNVTGAVPGQYIVPVNDNGAIKGIAVNEDDLTMSQYIKAVGKVIKVVNGKPTIIVKVA